MCHPLLCSIVQLEKHRISDVKPSQLIQGTGRHDNLATVVHILSLWSRHHCYRIATVVLVEAASGTAAMEHGGAHDSLHRVVLPKF